MGRLLLIVSLFMGGCGGCGDDSKVGRLPDAPPPPDGAPDAMVDASTDAMIDAPIDAAPPTVKLTVTRNGSPALQVQVYFQNADNSLVKSVKTDNNGEAEAVMDAGGSVTAINPFTTPLPAVLGIPQIDELRTFVGVKPGDHLFLTFNDSPESTTVAVTVPDAAADFYDINTTCGSGRATPPPPELLVAAVDGNVSVAPGCTAADFLVFAQNFNEGPPIPVSGFSHNDVDVTDDVDFTLDPPDTYVDPVDVTYNYTSIPGNAGSITVQHYLTSKNDKMFVESYGGDVSFEGSSATEVFAEPALLDAHLGTLLSTFNMNAPHAVLAWGPNKTEYDTDLDDTLRDVVGQLSYDSSVQQVQWEEDTTGGTPDLTVVSFQVNRVEEPTTREWNWVIAAPYSNGSLQVPTVPDDVNDFMPTSDDSVDIRDFVNVKVTLPSPAPSGYDAIRARILDLQQVQTATAFVSGASGQVEIVGPAFIPERSLRAGKAVKAGRFPSLSASLMAKNKLVRTSPKAARTRGLFMPLTAAKAAMAKVTTGSSKAKAAPASTKALKAARARRAPAAASIAPSNGAGAPSIAAVK